MVEGLCAGRAGGNDRFHHRLRIANDFACPNPKHVYPTLVEPSVSNRIVLWPVNHIVAQAIKLDGGPCFAAEEVEDVRPRRVLTAEFEPAWPGAKPNPQYDFRHAHRAPQPAGACYGLR
jgi:hypothetical protein